MNWTKTPPTKPGAYWWKAQTGAIKCCEVFTDRDGNSIAQGFGISDDVYLLRGEWSELVPAEELQKAQADAAAMREALTKERAAIARFLVPWRSHLDQSWLDNFVESGSVRFNEIGYVFPVEVSTNTGSELLAELKRLRAQHEFSDGQAAYYARLCDTKDAELNSLRDELKSAREEVERAKADRNKSGVEERKKYLPKIQQLTADLAKAKAQCANLSDSLRECLGYCDRMGQEGVRERAVAALSPNCGRDYVHRSEVEKAWHEGFIDGDFGEARADDCWNQSRARKVATGEVT